MGLFGIEFGRPKTILSALPVVWEMQLRAAVYTEIQLRSIYARILSEVIARSHSIPDEFRSLIRDSMEGDGQRGLTEHIVTAMANQAQLVLKYEAGLLHVPEYGDRQTIVNAWKKGEKPNQTLVLSFANYHRTMMLRQYLHHKYLLLCTQHKALNLSSALQIKINDMRKSIGLSDSDPAIEQARQIADALLSGTPALLDAKDTLDLLAPDISALKEVAADLHSEISLILGLPISWVTGAQKVGLGDSGDADARSIERGLEPYFWESVHPAFLHLFKINLKLKSEDYRNIDSAVKAAQALDIMSDDLVSLDNKRVIVSRLLDIENDLEGDPREEVEVKADIETGSGRGDGAAPSAASAGDTGVDVQKTALNGAQVTALTETVEAVAMGRLPRDAGVNIAMLAFQLSPQDANRVFGSVGKGFKPVVEQPEQRSDAPPPRGAQ